MAVDLYLIRHGESEGNHYRRCHGHTNSQLTPNGRLQARALAERLYGIPIAAVYSSDLRRAMETARLAIPHLPPNAVPGLREIFLGMWEDLPWGEVMHSWPDAYEAFIPPDGESHNEVQARMRASLHSIATAHAGQSVAVVSHGMALRLLCAALTGQPQPHWDNASLGLVRYEGGVFRLVFAGDNAHLGALSSFARQNWWKGGQDINLRFRAASLPEDEILAKETRMETWAALYGASSGFSEASWSAERKAMRQGPPWSLQTAFDGETAAGVLELQTTQGTANGDGHIAFLYLTPAYRGRGVAPQLIGEAANRYRGIGRQRLTLRVSPRNQKALRFYQNAGFVHTGDISGAHGPLHIMSMEL
jgi:probable phosphoglycerate mutase